MKFFIPYPDFTDLAHRKYARLTSQLKPDLESYGTQKLKASLSTDIVGGTEEQIYRDANSLAFVDGVGVKPSRDNVDKMVEDLQKQYVSFQLHQNFIQSFL